MLGRAFEEDADADLEGVGTRMPELLTLCSLPTALPMRRG